MRETTSPHRYIGEPPIDETEILLKWLNSQIFTSSDYQDVQIPTVVQNLIRDCPDSHFFLPVFQRILYAKSKQLNKVYDGNATNFLKWIESSSTHLGLLYLIFKLGQTDITLLKRTEFAIYQGFIRSIWNDIISLLMEPSYELELVLISKVLGRINLTNDLDNLIYQVVKKRIVEKIETLYCDEPVYSKLVIWLDMEIYPGFHSFVSLRNRNEFYQCINMIAKSILISRRILDSYELVDSYPKSTETLKEFNVCLAKEDQKEILVRQFINDLNTKLLIPSTNTVDIIIYYIKTIHSFLIIDHRGVLLDKVTRPIRRHLRSREDTVEKVVNGLLDKNKRTNRLIELNVQLQKITEDNFGTNSLCSLQKRTLNWEPDPVDALPDFQVGKIDDIIDSLTTIFEDSSVFINQFVNVFSRELLYTTGYDIQSTLQKLALLKAKFSNDDFSKVDIMINDIKRSKELDKDLHSNTEIGAVHGVFLSHLYWPNLPEEIPSFVLPDYLLVVLKSYEDVYTQQKRKKELRLHPQVSLATLDILIRGETKTFTVSFDKLAVINYICESKIPVVKLGILLMNLKMPLQILKSSLEFWVNEEVLVEQDGGWKVNE